ncbi:hypothetical protein K469DRAFT_710919 [Zopfia rhizophila CBS 207.26]|uniref:Uncharacterized protein n=1 Tax=Zopfia rhizophila CBS 207.26 TaxID=1314779 RepID=A0A6A6DXA9_9PEZI|nr:hypothetical protein K469DRAFT_710919 [Zopfia rhizophila CBS 207.26]
MPLFGSRKVEEPAPTTTTTKTTSPPARNRSIFSRRRSSSPSLTSPSTTTSTSPKRHSGLLHRHAEDASIIAARERVIQAEAAEKEADRALVATKNAVKDAREHVRKLEREATEEARLAKIKQNHAKAIGKRGKALGRHEHIF